MVNTKIMWGYNDKDDVSKGWYIKISDSLTGELWAERIMDVSEERTINIRGNDIGYIEYMIHNIYLLEDRCRVEKYNYEENIAAINNLSPSDFG